MNKYYQSYRIANSIIQLDVNSFHILTEAGKWLKVNLLIDTAHNVVFYRDF